MNLNLNNNSFTRVSDIQIPDIYYKRMKTGVGRIDRSFGNGFLPGSIFTVTGSPGSGKTTYLLQVLELLAKRGYKVAYASGEECVEMMACNCKRIGVKNVLISNETNIDELIKVTVDYDFLVVDSFASVTSNIKSSRQHEKYVVQELCKASKKNQCTVGMVLHISKSGQYKGGTIIPHSVDTVVHLHRDMVEGQPDRYVSCIVTKNRFGPTSETTLLMTGAGYDWQYQPKPADVITSSVAPKSQRKDTEMKKIMTEFAKSKSLQLAQAQEVLKENAQRTSYILRELTIGGKLKKVGRGQTAVYYKKVDNHID
jgi:predicted ATP-dependent serine protease